MRAFVTDGDERPALAITRSLGRRGFSVLVGEERRASLAAASRYCTSELTYPSAYRYPDRFARWLLDFVARERIDVVVPVSDVTTHAVARHREAVGRYSATAAPSLEAFETAADKYEILKRAAACGIPVPRTVLVQGASSLTAGLGAVRYPAVVKPVRSRIPTADGWLPASVRYARSQAELLRLFAETPALARHPSLIQERAPGRGVGVFVLCDRGRIVTAFAHRRLREKPPSGGVSVLAESVAVDEGLRCQARRLLEPLGWHGVAMLEYKQDRTTGRAVLMEVNGRFWGSLQLAVDAGVDFPYLSCQLALGRPLDLPPSYTVGVRSRWLLGDLDHLLARLLHDGADLPADAPPIWRAVLDFFTCAPAGQRHEIFRRGDIGPAVREAARYGAAIATATAARLRSRASLGGRPECGPLPSHTTGATRADALD